MIFYILMLLNFNLIAGSNSQSILGKDTDPKDRILFSTDPINFYLNKLPDHKNSQTLKSFTYYKHTNNQGSDKFNTWVENFFYDLLTNIQISKEKEYLTTFLNNEKKLKLVLEGIVTFGYYDYFSILLSFVDEDDKKIESIFRKEVEMILLEEDNKTEKIIRCPFIFLALNPLTENKEGRFLIIKYFYFNYSDLIKEKNQVQDNIIHLAVLLEKIDILDFFYSQEDIRKIFYERNAQKKNPFDLAVQKKKESEDLISWFAKNNFILLFKKGTPELNSLSNDKIIDILRHLIETRNFSDFKFLHNQNPDIFKKKDSQGRNLLMICFLLAPLDVEEDKFIDLISKNKNYKYMLDEQDSSGITCEKYYIQTQMGILKHAGYDDRLLDDNKKNKLIKMFRSEFQQFKENNMFIHVIDRFS